MKRLFLFFLFGVAGCSNISYSPTPFLTPTTATIKTTPSTVDLQIIPDYQNNIISIDECNLTLDVSIYWEIEKFPSTGNPGIETECPGVILTRPDRSLTLTIKPNLNGPVNAYEPCPVGTVIVKHLAPAFFIVRVPSTNSNGYLYSNASIIFTSNSTKKIYACQFPAGVVIANKLFTVELSKEGALFDQSMDIDISDAIINSLKTLPYQY